MSAIPDERLALVFTCCHPALATEAQVALTLREVGGLTTARDRPRVLDRRDDDGPAARAGEAEDPAGRHPVPRPARRGAARTGCGPFSPSSISSSTRATSRSAGDELVRAGALRRGDPARQAARRPDARRAGGARPARADAAPRLAARGALAVGGELVLLEDQDRSLWDRGTDRRGPAGARTRVRTARGRAVPAPGAIAAVHCGAGRPRTPTGGDRRALRASSARARAVAHRRAEPRGSGRDGRRARRRASSWSTRSKGSSTYQLLHSARADLLRRLDRPAEAPRRTGARSS